MENNNKYLPYKSLKNKTLPINLLLILLSSIDSKELHDILIKIKVKYDWKDILIFRLEKDLEWGYSVNNESIRIEIEWIYYWQFLLSDIPKFINKKSMDENILFKSLNLIITNDWNFSFENYKKISWIKSFNSNENQKYNNFRKTKEKISKALKYIFNLETDPFKYDKKNRIYNSKFFVKIINEDIYKNTFKRKYARNNK